MKYQFRARYVLSALSCLLFVQASNAQKKSILDSVPAEMPQVIEGVVSQVEDAVGAIQGNVNNASYRAINAQWTHAATPDVTDQDLDLTEDFRQQMETVTITAATQTVLVTPLHDIYGKMYQYAPSSIILEPTAFDITFDLSMHSIRIKGGSHHHEAIIQKNSGTGSVVFNISNGNMLRIVPKK